MAFFCDASDGRTIPVYNPSNGEKLSEIAAAAKDEVVKRMESLRLPEKDNNQAKSRNPP